MTNKKAIELIEANKQKVSELISSFSESIKNKECEKVILNVFHKLSYFSSEIFIGEEILMKENKNPLIFEYIKEHSEYVNKIKYFQKEYENKKPNLCVELLEYIKQWHEHHILKTDKIIINNSSLKTY